MLLNVFASISGIVLASILFDFISSIVRTKNAVRRFKANLKGMPIADGLNLFGHLDQFFTGKNWKYIDEQHKKHGRYFAMFYRNNVLVLTTDLDLITSMVFDEPQSINRAMNLDIPVAELVEASIAFARDDQWRKLRKHTAPAFSSLKVKSPAIKQRIEQIVEKFVASLERRFEKANERNESSIVIDAEDLFHRYALEVVFTCFYERPNEVDFDSAEDWWQRSVDVSLKLLDNPMMKYSVMLPNLNRFLIWALELHPQYEGAQRIRQFIREQTARNLEARKKAQAAKELGEHNVTLYDGPKFRRSLIDHIIDQFHDRKLQPSEYMSTVAFLFSASNKTSADLMSKLVYLLGCHEGVQEKLRASVARDGVESEYLSWCINETLRLYPPGPGGCSRTAAKDLATKDGYLVRKGSWVITPVYTIHRLREFWGEDADEFRPERFENSRRFHPAQFMPFGLGVRRCPGADFAMAEVKPLICRLVHSYKWQYLPGDNTGGIVYGTPLLTFSTYEGQTNIRFVRLIDA